MVINEKIAKIFDIKVGDSITLRDTDRKALNLKVSGIFENFIDNMAYINPQSCVEQWETPAEYKTALVQVKDGKDVYDVSSDIMAEENIASVSVNDEMRTRVNKSMERLDYIVVLVIFCAGALAFIVLYNLTNINITERIREISTIKVLGFTPKETAEYVFRENFFLTGIGALVGLLFGWLLHMFVMNQINIDAVSFDIRISFISYILSVLITFVFAIIVNIFMYIKLEKINMAEALKSIE